MIDDPVRLGNLPQGLAFMTFLPARWLVASSERCLRRRRESGDLGVGKVDCFATRGRIRRHLLLAIAARCDRDIAIGELCSAR
jgi:hypothetical protein